ncbi:hypothetical protein BSAF29S_01192 [Bacillus safensis subsp. safensis]
MFHKSAAYVQMNDIIWLYGNGASLWTVVISVWLYHIFARGTLKNMNAPIVLDQDYEIVAKYKIQGLPSFCLFDQEGQLIDRKMGDTGWERILKKLEKHSIG